eukprot:1160625-Pelagomonas_calceolata.AAC.2
MGTLFILEDSGGSICGSTVRPRAPFGRVAVLHGFSLILEDSGGSICGSTMRPRVPCGRVHHMLQRTPYVAIKAMLPESHTWAASMPHVHGASPCAGNSAAEIAMSLGMSSSRKCFGRERRALQRMPCVGDSAAEIAMSLGMSCSRTCRLAGNAVRCRECHAWGIQQQRLPCRWECHAAGNAVWQGTPCAAENAMQRLLKPIRKCHAAKNAIESEN